VTKSTTRLILPALALAVACGGPATKPQTAPPTPTPGSLSRTNPNIVEEDELHIVERFPKEEYIRVDDRHIRNPLIGPAVEFYKEDEKYYYVYTDKRTPDMAAAQALLRTPTVAPGGTPVSTPTPAGPALSEFEDLSPPRAASRIRLESVVNSGLPSSGLWRASFVVADMNGDGIPDIVAPPPRLAGAKLQIWIGDGKGHFSSWPLRFVEDGKPREDFSVDYGGVAVGDIDGDGRADLAVPGPRRRLRT